MANNRGRSTLGLETDAIEAGRKAATTLGSEVKNELAKSARTFWDQVLGTGSSKAENQAAKNEVPVADQMPGLVFSRAVHADRPPESSRTKVHRFEKQKNENVHASESSRKPEARAAIEYHEQFTRSVTDFDRRANERQKRELSQQIQEIMSELKKLIATTKDLKTQFGGVTVESKPVEVGTYHISFFEWMLLVIKQAKQKVEDAGAWLSTMKGKGGKKSGYWDMFKKHGTSFGLSNERSVATQVG